MHNSVALEDTLNNWWKYYKIQYFLDQLVKYVNTAPQTKDF